MGMHEIIRLVRLKHWIKNGVVFLPVLFSANVGNLSAWYCAALAALAFCFASSFGYIINDIKDRRSDCAHPFKKNRPIAAGRIKVGQAAFIGVLFVIISTILAWLISPILLFVIVGYLLLQIFYTILLKQIVLIDVICISLGFVLRAMAGAVAIQVEVSCWLFICMFTLCLFMGFCKRYSEIMIISDKEMAINHRPILIEYTPQLLTHLITLSAGIAVVAFLFYGVSESTVARFGTVYFVYTLPVMVYGIFRFAMLSMKGAYHDPTELILNDRPFQATVILWLLLSAGIISYGSELHDWLGSLY